MNGDKTMVKPGDLVMVAERYANHEGHIGIVTDPADAETWGDDEWWIVFGRDEPAIDEGSDRRVWHYPSRSLFLLGRATVFGDVAKALLFELCGEAGAVAAGGGAEGSPS